MAIARRFFAACLPREQEPNIRTHRIIKRALVLTFAALAAAHPLRADNTTYTFTGGSYPFDWSNPGDWLNGLVPPGNSTDSLIFFDPISSPSVIDNAHTDWLIGGLQLWGTTGPLSTDVGVTLDISGTAPSSTAAASPILFTARSTAIPSSSSPPPPTPSTWESAPPSSANITVTERPAAVASSSLLLSAAQAANAASTFTVNTGATLEFAANYDFTTGPTLTGTGLVTIDPGVTLTLPIDTAFAGTIQINGTLFLAPPLNPANAGITPAFTVLNNVPEPASLAFLLMGLPLLRRRKFAHRAS